MELQTVYVIGALVIAGLGLYNFIKGHGKTEGSTELQLKHTDENEKTWNIRFDALHNMMELHRSQTSERFEKMLERLNEALLTMAREHPTKSDLQMVKHEILDRIDGYEPQPRPKPTKRAGRIE